MSVYLLETKRWLKAFVIDLGICPFAMMPYLQAGILYEICEDDGLVPLVNAILEAAKAITDVDNAYVTALVICPKLSLDFSSWHAWCADVGEHLLAEMELQAVAFHPDFHYKGEDPADTTQSTNRSPYPMIHLLRKQDLDEITVEEGHRISSANKARLSKMTWEEIGRWKKQDGS